MFISFFTSLDANSSAGISICIGVSEKRFQNTIVVDMNVVHKGCIASKSVSDMFGTYYNKISDLPTLIFDINYLGGDVSVTKLLQVTREQLF